MSAGGRWTLVQALAWVLTRDRDLVDGFGMPALGGRPQGLLDLVVRCAAGREELDLTRNTWLPLAERIVAGDIRADGRPALNGMDPADRQPLAIEARDVGPINDTSSAARGCFLSGPSEGPRNWYDVELIAQDVESVFPAADALANPAPAAPPKRTLPGQQRSVLEAKTALYPKGIPPGLPVQQRNDAIKQWLRGSGRSVSDATIGRALSAIDRD